MTALRSSAATRTARTTAWALDGAPDWRAQALCGPATAEWFALGRSSLTDANLAALQMCRACPVRRDCAEHVLGVEPHLRQNLIEGGMTFNGDGEQVPPRLPSYWTLQDRAKRRALTVVNTVNSEGERR